MTLTFVALLYSVVGIVLWILDRQIDWYNIFGDRDYLLAFGLNNYIPSFGPDFSTGGFPLGGLYSALLTALLLFGESLSAQFVAMTIFGLLALALFGTLVHRVAGVLTAGAFILPLVSSSAFTAITWTLRNPAHALPMGLVALYCFYRSAVDGESIFLPAATGIAAVAGRCILRI